MMSKRPGRSSPFSQRESPNPTVTVALAPFDGTSNVRPPRTTLGAVGKDDKTRGKGQVDEEDEVEEVEGEERKDESRPSGPPVMTVTE